jgi:Tol biopolymer transport system component
MDDDGTHEAAERGPRSALDDAPLAPGAPATPDGRWWSNVDVRHRVLRRAGITGAILALALAVGTAVAIVGSQMSGNGSANSGVARSSGTPTAAVVATSSALASSTASTASVSATATVAATSTSAAVAGRAARVAYRQSGAIWVCDEKGGSARRVVAATSGTFALSPDGKTLAVVDGTTAKLMLVDVASRSIVVVGAAELEDPSWASDSSFLAYTALPGSGHDTVVRRVSRTGTGVKTLGTGSMPCVAPDGSVVAVSGTRSSGTVPIVVYGSGSRLMGRTINTDAVAATTSTVAFCDAGSAGVQGTARDPRLGVIGLDGTGQRTLVKRPTAGGSAFFGEVDMTPDGKRIVYTENGDDGYSRIFVVPVSGGTPRKLSLRRDAYIVGFSADGTQLFYVDGNAEQEESTRLMAVRLDGTGRRLVVDGAGL